MGSLPMNPTVRSVAVDPSDPNRVYAAGPAGLFLSDDAGLTWGSASGGWASEHAAIALDPSAPQHLFVVLADGSLWASEDRGKFWKLLGLGEEENE